MIVDNAARAFPILLLAMLAVLAFWLDQASTMPEVVGKYAAHEPDLLVTGFTAIGYGENGKPYFRLKADSMTHYQEGDAADLKMARLVRTFPGSPDLTVSGSRAHVTARGNEVFFEKDVAIQRAATATSLPLNGETTQLWLDTKNGMARTNQKALLWNDVQRTQTTGFDYNHEEALLHMHANVNIDYARKKH